MVLTESPSDSQHFKQIIEPWAFAYRYAVCTALAIKVGPEWLIFRGRVLLHTAKPDIQSFSLETQCIRAHNTVIPIGTVVQLLDSASEGKLLIKDEKFCLKPAGANDFSSSLIPFCHPEVEGILRVPALRIYGNPKQDFLSIYSLEHLNWDLKSADQPFDTFDELLLYLGLPAIYNLGDFATLEIVAGSPAIIKADSRIEAGHALINIRIAKSLDPTKLRLGYKVMRGASMDRSAIDGNAFKWGEDEDWQDGSVQVAIGDSPVLQAFISYDRLAMHQWWVVDETKRLNPRHAIYEAFDKELKILKAFITGQGNDTGRDFENAVTIISSLLGFSVVPLCVLPHKLTDAPDLIVSTPKGHIAVIECTTKHLNEQNKLAKLIRRTKTVKEGLASTGHAHLNVQPVIVTMLTRSDIQAELEEAGKHKIAVISKELLETWVDREIVYPNAEGLFLNLSQYIPRNEGQQSPSGEA